jgi:hypothetical protein
VERFPRTNTRGIESAIEKAVARAEWYKKSYRGAKDFQKRYIKQFYTTLNKFIKRHDLTQENIAYLKSKVPEMFSVYFDKMTEKYI